MGGATFTYVVRSLATMGATTDAGGIAHNETYGFDLDGRDSDGTLPEDCGVVDGVSSDGRRGIDNTIAGLWTEDFEHGFVTSETEAGGSMASVIRLSGVDSFDDDGCVDVAWVTDVPQFGRARIEAGRLVAEGSGPVPVRGKGMPLNASPIPLVFPVSSPRITFRPSAGALTGGVVGGSMTVDQLQEIYRRVLPFVADISSVAHPDLPAGGRACALLSAGFAFEAAAVPSP